jgi:methyl-accepting chemotaxis protein
MKNIKISVKLLMGFTIVAIIAAIIGITGVININNIKNSDKELYTTMIAPFEPLIALNNDYQDMRIIIRNAVISTDANEINDYITEFNQKSTDFDDAVALFSKTITSDEIQSYANSLITAKKGYVKICEQILQLTKNEATQDEALALMNGEGKNVATELVATGSRG